MAYALTVSYSPNFSLSIALCSWFTKIFPHQVFPMYSIQLCHAYFTQADVLTMMGVSGNTNAMETDQPNTNKKYYIDTNSVCVARENMDVTTLIKDSMSKYFMYLSNLFTLYRTHTHTHTYA